MSKYSGCKELRTYGHHTKDGVYCMHYSPDGNTVAVGYGDSGLEIINTHTGKLVKCLHRHKYGAMVTMSTKFNPADPNMLMATHGQGSVLCYNVTTGASVDVSHEDNEEILCMDFSHDGRHFATGGQGMDIFIYDVATNRRLYTLAGYCTRETVEDQGGHTKRVFALRFFPTNPDLLVTGGWDGHLKAWDLRQPDPKTARVISGPKVCGDGIDMKDGKILAASWRRTEAVQMFDFASGELIGQYPMRTRAPENKTETDGEYPYCARFCDDSTILVGGSGTLSVQAIDTTSKNVIGEVMLDGPVQAMDCYGGGKQFAFGGKSLQLKICKMVK